MKILMISPEPFLEPRGTPISIYQRLKAVSKLGHQVDLLTYHIGQDVDIPNVRIHRIMSIPIIRQVRVGPSWAKLVLDMGLFAKALRMLARNRYDLIHSHEEAAFFATLLARIFRVKHLYDMHSSLPKQLKNFNFANYRPVVKLFEVFERWTVKSCDAMITIGPDLEQHAKRIKPTVKLVTIENTAVGYDRDKINERSIQDLRLELGLDGKLPIVYTGTFEAYQGLELLVHSAKVLKSSHPEIVFVLVGGKPKQIESFERVISDHQLNDLFRLVGTVPIDEVWKYLLLAEILVSPRIEGTSVPLKIYTYMQAGKPIVATDLLAHSLVLDKENAVLVSPTEGEFSQGLLKVIENPELRHRLGARSKQLADQRNSPGEYLSRVERVYRLLEPSSKLSDVTSRLSEH